ncbi:MAG: helix-turn-helix transcriptional regulator [Cellulosilyticum sp.]|nr:helix-turn-helix transcriptional regulator [Cellulosilyticum sp.]
MGKKKRESIEFRYYELPQDEWVLVLTGQKWTRIYGRDVAGLHFHNLLEIGYCLDGTGDLIFEDRHYRFEKQMISAIPAHFPHTTVSDIDILGTWEYIFIDAEGFLREMYKESPLFAQKLIDGVNKNAIFIDVKESETMMYLIKGIVSEAIHKKEFYSESIKGITLALLLELVRMNENEAIKNKVRTKNNMQIERALTYVAEKYAEPLKIEELADECHMSEPHFRRLFGEYMNMSPLEYINLIRIQKACELIKKTNDSMRNIAIKVGYPTPCTFDRNFKKIVGMPPNEWRRQSENYEGKLLNYNISTLKGW